MNFKMGVPGCECCGCESKVIDLTDLFPNDVVSLGTAKDDFQIDLSNLIQERQGFPLRRSDELYIDINDGKNTRITLSVRSTTEELVNDGASWEILENSKTGVHGWGDQCKETTYGELYYVDSLVATLTSDGVDDQEFVLSERDFYQYQIRYLDLYNSERVYIGRCFVRTYKKFWDKAIGPAHTSIFDPYPRNYDRFIRERREWYGDIDSPTRDNKFFLAHTDGRYKEPLFCNPYDPSSPRYADYTPDTVAGDFYYFIPVVGAIGATAPWQQISPYNKQVLQSSAINGQPQTVGVRYTNDQGHYRFTSTYATTNNFLPPNIGPPEDPEFGDTLVNGFANDEVTIQVTRKTNGEEQTFYIYDNVADSWSEHTFGKDNRVYDFTVNCVGDDPLSFGSDQTEMTAFGVSLGMDSLPAIKFRDGFIELSSPTPNSDYDYVDLYKLREGSETSDPIESPEKFHDWIPMTFEGMDLNGCEVTLSSNMEDDLPKRLDGGIVGPAPNSGSMSGEEFDVTVDIELGGQPSSMNFYISLDAEDHSRVKCVLTLPAGGTPVVFDFGDLSGSGPATYAFEASPLPDRLVGAYTFAFTEEPPEAVEEEGGEEEDWVPTLSVSDLKISYTTASDGIRTSYWTVDDLQNENQCTAVYKNMDCLDADTCSTVSNHGHQQWDVEITSPSSYIRFADEDNKYRLYDGCTTTNLNNYMDREEAQRLSSLNAPTPLECPVYYFDFKETVAEYEAFGVGGYEVTVNCGAGTVSGNTCTFDFGGWVTSYAYAQYGQIVPECIWGRDLSDWSSGSGGGCYYGDRTFTTGFYCHDTDDDGFLEEVVSYVVYSGWAPSRARGGECGVSAGNHKLTNCVPPWDECDDERIVWARFYFLDDPVFTSAKGGETSFSTDFAGANADYQADATVTCEKDVIGQSYTGVNQGYTSDRFWQQEFQLYNRRKSVGGDCIFELTSDFQYEQYVSEQPEIKFVKQYSILTYDTFDLTTMSGYDDNYSLTQKAMMNPETTRTWYFAVLEAPPGTTGWGPEEFNTNSNDPQSDYAPFVENDYDFFVVSGGLLKTVEPSTINNQIPLTLRAQQSGDMTIDFEFGSVTGGARIYNSAFEFGYETLFDVTGGSIVIPSVQEGDPIAIYVWTGDGGFAAVSRVSQELPKRQYWKWEPQKSEPEYHSEYDGVEPPDITPNNVEFSVESSGSVTYQGGDRRGQGPIYDPQSHDTGWIKEGYSTMQGVDGTPAPWAAEACDISLEDRLRVNSGWKYYIWDGSFENWGISNAGKKQRYVSGVNMCPPYEERYECDGSVDYCAEYNICSYALGQRTILPQIDDYSKFVAAPEASIPATQYPPDGGPDGSNIGSGAYENYYSNVTVTPVTVTHINEDQFCPGDPTEETTDGFVYTLSDNLKDQTWDYVARQTTNVMGAGYLLEMSKQNPFDSSQPYLGRYAYWPATYYFHTYKKWGLCWSDDDAAYDRDPIQFELTPENTRELYELRFFGGAFQRQYITETTVLTHISVDLDMRSTDTQNEVRVQSVLDSVVVDLTKTVITIKALPNWTYENDVLNP